MITSKKSGAVLGLAFIGLMIISFVGIALLAVLIDELAESGRDFPNFIQACLAYREAWQDSTGDEFSGEATAWLFGALSVPVGVDLISRTIIRYMPFGETGKRLIRRVNGIQRKYLLPFHTYLSSLALALGILHLTLSSCTANPLPELGLILSGILVATGLLFKWNIVPKNLRKALYRFHTSLVVTGALLVILYTGHAVMDMD